ncbi:MAG TPA: DUF2318 domain-containing protein [Clostridiales bacterium]|nr:DUF2318 domain-containing protein [Clostridiales bacterium]
MGKSNKVNKKVKTTHKTYKKTFAAIAVIAVLVTGLIIIKLSSGGVTGAESGDLKILKSEVSDTVKFYPYKAGRTNMEVLAVLASDGTVRTAFNTCQVCYDSGRGYYKQEGNELVCQNCGNRFRLDQVEKIKGGCNPVPITAEDKTEDDTSIVISQVFLEANKGLFGNWRK